MSNGLKLTSDLGISPDSYFQIGFPERSLRLRRFAENLNEYEDYERELISAYMLMKKYLDLIAVHPELAVPDEHSDFGGYEYIAPSLFVEMGGVNISENYSGAFNWIAEKYPSYGIDPRNWTHGGFPSEATTELYNQDFLN